MGTIEFSINNSPFAKTFGKRGPLDPQGRSLYQLQMEGRVFRYPLSYLIYSKAIAELPTEAQDYLWPELQRILDSPPNERDYKNLSQDDKPSIRQILEATHPRFK